MDWTEGLDDTRPSAARMYDYYLGGCHNFQVDRAAAQRMIRVYPLTIESCRANRGFLRRAVRFVAEQGVTQFLDIGSGIPTVGNVHEVAQAVNPAASTVYVDLDAVAVQHGLQLLSDNPRATAIAGDLRDAAALLERIRQSPELTPLLDLTRPTGLVLTCVLHFVEDDRAYDAVARLLGALAPGSFLVLSHATVNAANRPAIDSTKKVYGEMAAIPLWFRGREEIERFFHDLKLVEPGMVWPTLWRPDALTVEFPDEPALAGVYAGVAGKP